MNIGITIRELRKRKNLSQEELSGLTNISQTYISQIESGKKTPTLDVLQTIGEKIGVPFQIISFLSLNEDAIPEGKREHYKAIEPAVKAMIKEYFLAD